MTSVNFGIDQLLDDRHLVKELKSRRVALLSHPASVTADLTHSLDALIERGINVSCAFGPQHGMRGDKQDNMIESPDFSDPVHGIPVVSLYGKHRRPTAEMLDTFDILLYDLQDIGCRIYTYNATLKYFLEACSGSEKSVWVLDRPNPAGRPVDGRLLLAGHESIVGFDHVLTRHGSTVGELAAWLTQHNRLNVNLKVIPMSNYSPDLAPGFGWPADRPWINPSPNAGSLNMARCFSGTVLIEGTTLSEGRGTSMPLEVIGAPDIDILKILAEMARLQGGSNFFAKLRPCFFEPTFHKHEGQTCRGVQIHTDHPTYDHDNFKPYRMVALFLKALRNTHKNYPLWRDHEYEYEPDRNPIDIIDGSFFLRTWVDDETTTVNELDSCLAEDARHWLASVDSYRIY